jgi:NAD(P)-dependent dehydrogenase (short-subunit alcohol dehydrogenase family)
VDLNLHNKVIVVTGGTDGLGRALALRLAQCGAQIATGGRNAQRRDSLAQELPDALIYDVDLLQPQQRAAFADAVISRWGHIDALVNNAGQSAATPVADSTDEQWREDYELKVIAATDLVRRFLPVLRDGGSILNIVATKGKAPSADSTPTSASRAAGLALTKALAGELAPRQIRVNALVIGLIESGQWERRAAASNMTTPEFMKVAAAAMRVPLGRFGRLDEFADVASFLLSERASYVTGAALNLDGGLSPVL